MGILSSITNGIRRFGNALVSGISIIGGLVGDVFSRIIGLPGFFLDLIGLRWQKKMRIRFVILRGARGAPIVSVDEIEPAFQLARQILDREADVTLIDRGRLIATGTPPDDALDVPSVTDTTVSALGGAAAYFAQLAGIGPLTRTISVIIVNSMGSNQEGRSYGPLHNYVLVTKRVLTDESFHSTVAHELGHACGLWHNSNLNRLMHAAHDRGENLETHELAILRASRFVWTW